MAGQSNGGKGNAQIPLPTAPKNAPIKKMGQTKGSKYGMDPSVKQKGGN